MMKLFSKTTGAILAAAVLFAACAAGPAQNAQGARDAQSVPASNVSTLPAGAETSPADDAPALSGQPSGSVAVSVSGLAMRTGVSGLGGGCASADGYYEFDQFREPHVLYYTDYATRQRVPLCGRPECKHSDETCTAVIPGASGIFEMDGHLFIVCTGENGAVSLLKMSLNGSERETVAALSSADRYDRAIAGAQNSLFTVMPVYRAEKNMQVPELVHIDLQTGKTQTLVKLDSEKAWFLVGAAGETLLLKSIGQTNDAPFGSPEAYASQVHELFVYDVPRAAMTSVLSWKQNEILDACYEDKLFLYSPAGAAFSVQRFGADGLEPVLTSRPLPLQNATDAYFYGFYDGRLVVELGENLAADSGGADYRWQMFAVDAQSGAVSQLTLKQTSGGVTEFVRPIAGSNGTLLVRSGMREQLLTFEGQDGSFQQYSAWMPVYAMIKSEDFFAGNPRYMEIR